VALGILLVITSTDRLAADEGQASSPTLLTPPTNTEIMFRIPAKGSIAFTWRGVPSATAYIVVAKSADFRKPVFQRRTTESFAVVRGLPEGRYFWRVEALPEDGTAPVSGTATFTISVGARL